jgi:hypothetical protein
MSDTRDVIGGAAGGGTLVHNLNRHPPWMTHDFLRSAGRLAAYLTIAAVLTLTASCASRCWRRYPRPGT